MEQKELIAEGKMQMADRKKKRQLRMYNTESKNFNNQSCLNLFQGLRMGKKVEKRWSTQ